jgi:hypothetical protein
MSLIRDTNLVKTKALPAAAATNYSDSIDLADKLPGIQHEAKQIEVAIPALPSLADAKTYTATLQDSADDSTFVDVAPLASIILTGASGAGAAAKTQLFPLPKDLRRYIRVKSVVQSAGGDNTAKSVTLSIVR